MKHYTNVEFVSMSSYRKTQFSGLVYARLGGLWSFFDASDNPSNPKRIGVCYPSKETLLSDLHRFGTDRGFEQI
jgi:hypothetical protein